MQLQAVRNDYPPLYLIVFSLTEQNLPQHQPHGPAKNTLYIVEPRQSMIGQFEAEADKTKYESPAILEHSLTDRFQRRAQR